MDEELERLADEHFSEYGLAGWDAYALVSSEGKVYLKPKGETESFKGDDDKPYEVSHKYSCTKPLTR
jgi:hypothetical protein